MYSINKKDFTKILAKMIVQEGIEEMLKKKTIAPVQNKPEQFVSSIFIDPKKSSGFRPVINLKNLNFYVEYNHFKMESLFLLNELLGERDYLCKLNLKDAYYSVPLHQDSQKYVKFQWSKKLHQFPCLCFGLASSPRVFAKLIKTPLATLRKLNIL